MAKSVEKTPEEALEKLEQEAKEIESRKAKIFEEIKANRKKSVEEAIGKAGSDFEEKFKIFMNHRQSSINKQNQINKLTADLNSDLSYIKDQYNIMKDTLVSNGANQEYLTDIIGEQPAVKTVSKSNGEKKRTKAKLPDGSVMSWVDLCNKYSIPTKEGANQRLTWFAAAKDNHSLPQVKIVDASTSEEVTVD